MVLGGGVFARRLDHDDGPLINEISAFMKEIAESSLIPLAM